MKKIIVTGSSGMLGSNVIYELNDKYEIFGVDLRPSGNNLPNELALDINDYREVSSAVKAIQPDCIIHCAAITNVDKCENDYALAHATNALATKNLASSIAPEVKIVYISTDSVFDGRNGNYTEEDLPSPVNNYARTKLEGELFVQQCAKNYIIIRTNIFGWNRVYGESFAEWVIHSLKLNKQINMFRDVLFSPLYANTLVHYIDRLLNMDFIGKIHLGSINAMSKYDFGLELARVFGLDSSLISPESIEKSGLVAIRPKNTQLKVIKAEGILGGLTTIENEIKKFYQKEQLVAK